jgi:hypothetical protein
VRKQNRKKLFTFDVINADNNKSRKKTIDCHDAQKHNASPERMG